MACRGRQDGTGVSRYRACGRPSTRGVARVRRLMLCARKSLRVASQQIVAVAKVLNSELTRYSLPTLCRARDDGRAYYGCNMRMREITRADASTQNAARGRHLEHGSHARRFMRSTRPARLCGMSNVLLGAGRCFLLLVLLLLSCAFSRWGATGAGSFSRCCWCAQATGAGARACEFRRGCWFVAPSALSSCGALALRGWPSSCGQRTSRRS
jgi:hypothetical protein